MTYIVKWQNNEQLTLEDLNAVGQGSRDTFDNLTSDAIDSGLKFASFPISQTSATAVNVGAGRLYKNGQQFSNEDSGGVAINLANYLPTTNGNFKIVSILAYGQENDSAGVPRSFLVNSANNTVEANNVSTRSVRAALVAPNAGAEAPSPLPAPTSSDQCEIARVKMGYSGIVSIEYVEDNRMVTSAVLNQRAKALEDWRNKAGAQIDTLGSDIANITNSIKNLPSTAIFQQIVQTLAQVQAKARVPASALNFHYDYLLAQAQSDSDATVASYLCNVQEGIRFPWAAQALGILQLLNPLEPKIKSGSGTAMMLPDYTEVARIDTIGNDGNISLSQSQYQNINFVQKSISRQQTTFGTSVTYCTNSLFWHQGTYDPTSGIFTRYGETYKVNYTGTSAGGAVGKHEFLRLTQFSTTTMTDTYTDAQVQNLTVSGSTKSQTFLCSQAGWMTSVDLAFAQVAATGDVTVLITQTTNGAPDFTKVISNTTVSAANLRVWPQTTNFPLKPTYLDSGKRYAIVCVTPGNHFVCYVANNKYAQGSLFDSTDGSWSQGDLTKDLAFRTNYAQFSTAICQVMLQPLQLQNGITDISLLYGSKIPTGCSILWEVQKPGDPLWYPLQSYVNSAKTIPLLGLPPLLQLRLTFVGTTDLMPGLDMTQTQTLVSRPGAVMQHWSTLNTIGVASSNIRVDLTVDYFDPASHAVNCQLMMQDNSVVSPSAVSTAADPNKSDRFIKTFTFSLGSAVTKFRIGASGTTNAVTKLFHVESRFDYES